MNLYKLTLVFLVLLFNFQFTSAYNKKKSFNMETDLLLVHFDCKTDVDDLHTAAGLATLISQAEYKGLNWHAVAGTYGIQDGLYVPPNSLMELAFNQNWSDAHNQFEKALKTVYPIALKTLENGGDVWIAEAGQSDFSAMLARKIEAKNPAMNISNRIHIVQHSNWNEEVTTQKDLEYLQKTIDYQKIPDGNAEGNGTPGFRTPDFTDWKSRISDNHLKSIWQLAVDLGNKYNGKEGRYNNEAIEAGGLDFSDLSEVCWILGIDDIYHTADFFERYLK